MNELIYGEQTIGVVTVLDEDTQEIVVMWEGAVHRELAYSVDRFGPVKVGDRVEMTMTLKLAEPCP